MENERGAKVMRIEARGVCIGRPGAPNQFDPLTLGRYTTGVKQAFCKDVPKCYACSLARAVPKRDTMLLR
jgi:hypothetical protein